MSTMSRAQLAAQQSFTASPGGSWTFHTTLREAVTVVSCNLKCAATDIEVGALAAGEIERDGVGTRNKPYRYWLKGKKEKWQDDPDYALWNLINPPRPEFPWEKK